MTLALLLGSVGVSGSADWKKEVDAYKRGDYDTAFRIWKPLAEQGNVKALYGIVRMYIWADRHRMGKY